MKYLLDTHVIMWALINDKRVSENIKKVILDQNNQIYYSTVSSWEIEIKHQKIKSFTLTGKQFCSLCDQNDILNLPIKNNHVIKLKDIINNNENSDHKDPFDKMLLAQSAEEKMMLITHDKKLLDYDTNNIILI